MRKIFLILACTFILTGMAFAAPTEMTPVELGNTAIVDTIAGTKFLDLLIPADGIIFANDDRTFIVLYDSSGGVSTSTIAAPVATVRTSFGDITVPALTISMDSANGNFSLLKIPTAYNVAGKVTLTISASDYIKAKVVKLAKGN